MIRAVLAALALRPSGHTVAAISILIITTAAVPAHAQFLPEFDTVRVRQMGYRNASGEVGVTLFFYGRDRALRSSLWALEDGSRHSINYHLSDDSGREVEKHREFSDGLTSIQRYLYDADGRLTGEDFERSDGVHGKARYQRDETGRLHTADLDNFRGWLTARIEYHFKDGTRGGAAISRDGVNIGGISYLYGEHGRLLEETWTLGEWWQTFSYEYEPIPDTISSASNPLFMMNPRYVVSAEDYDFNGEGGGPSHYTYDDDDMLIRKVFERSDGLTTATTFEYDATGSLTKSHREYGDGRSVDFSYAYDDALRLTEKRFTRSDGVEGFERYTYDRFGRLRSAVCRNLDFWLNGTITFNFDSRGRRAGGRFDGEDGFDADIEIATDEHGNVIRVHWDFTFGKTQTYTLGYRPRRSGGSRSPAAPPA